MPGLNRTNKNATFDTVDKTLKGSNHNNKSLTNTENKTNDVRSTWSKIKTAAGYAKSVWKTPRPKTKARLYTTAKVVDRFGVVVAFGIWLSICLNGQLQKIIR